MKLRISLITYARGKSAHCQASVLETFDKRCFTLNFLCVPHFFWGYPDLGIKGQNIHSFVISSVQFSRSIVSDSLWPHELQHARPPCPSPTPEVYSNSRPSSRWCHPAISSSVIPFSSFPQSLPASESFPMSQLFAWGGLSTGVSALASFLPKNTQDWSPSEWTGWISLQSKGLSRVCYSLNICWAHWDWVKQ